MTNLPVSTPGDPHDLLSATHDLARRVRRTQRGAWFPLLVFAAVTLGAIPFYRYGHPDLSCAATHGGGRVCLVYPTVALWYWAGALLVAYAAITGFYVRRARQRGVGTRVQPHVAAGALLAVLTTAWALWSDAHPAFLAEHLLLGTSQHMDLLNRIASPAGGIGLALLLLSWIERSWPLLAVTVVYLFAEAAVRFGPYAHPSPWNFLPHLLLDGGILLLGGLVVALTQPAQGPSAA